MERPIISRERSYSAYHMSKYVSRNAVHAVREGIDKGFDPNHNANPFRTTLLHQAAFLKKHKIVEYLLTLPSINANIEDNEGDTPISLACKHGHFYIVRLLADKLTVREFDNPNNQGLTPLLVSYKNGHIPIAKFLLKKGCNYNIVSFEGFRLQEDFVNQTLRPLRERRRRNLLEQQEIRRRLQIERRQIERQREIDRQIQNDRERERIFRPSHVLIRLRNTEERNERVVNTELRQPPPLVQIKKEIPNHVMSDHIEMMIELKKSCPICCEIYETEKIKPIMTKCGHSLCIQCLSKINESTKKECPICRNSL